MWTRFTERGIVLTTEDGFVATNTIVLEPHVIEALEAYLKERRNELSHAAHS